MPLRALQGAPESLFHHKRLSRWSFRPTSPKSKTRHREMPRQLRSMLLSLPATWPTSRVPSGFASPNRFGFALYGRAIILTFYYRCIRRTCQRPPIGANGTRFWNRTAPDQFCQPLSFLGSVSSCCSWWHFLEGDGPPGVIEDPLGCWGWGRLLCSLSTPCHGDSKP